MGNLLLEEDEPSGLSAGLSLPGGVAAAAPLVGFAVGIVLGQRWPSVTGVGVTAPGNGTHLVGSVLERERGWHGFAEPALGCWDPFAEFLTWLTAPSQGPAPFPWTTVDQFTPPSPHQPQAELLHKPSPSFHIALSSLTLQPQRSHLSSRCLYHDLHCYWVLNIIFFSPLPYTSFPHANCSE